MSEPIKQVGVGRHLKSIQWAAWSMLNLAIVGYFGYAFLGPPSPAKASLLPGETTHGHYQIELDCNACHDSSVDRDDMSGADVMQDACIRCHGDQLKLANDTHPAKKFNDPSNAALLETLNAQDCLACHVEHVPEQTASMGLTLPSDYCWHCHQEVGDDRPSHAGMTFDSCATAGCHNYHDNRALYEKFLDEHHGEPDHFENAIQPMRDFASRWAAAHPEATSLTLADVDAPAEAMTDAALMNDWAETAHARGGVGCGDCHTASPGDETASWSGAVSMQACETCHQPQTDSFVRGKHGMRLAAGMTPMQPSMARLPMHVDAAHRELSCNSCHAGHRYDTQYAAVEACQSCHADSHSMAYANSSHAQLWQDELAGDGPIGSGVTCATCHMPRTQGDDGIWVNHDQNAVLRPNETMAREVCASCHGLDYSLSALADPELMLSCYDQPPAVRTKSVQMAHDYFEAKRQKRGDRRRGD